MRTFCENEVKEMLRKSGQSSEVAPSKKEESRVSYAFPNVSAQFRGLRLQFIASGLSHSSVVQKHRFHEGFGSVFFVEFFRDKSLFEIVFLPLWTANSNGEGDAFRFWGQTLLFRFQFFEIDSFFLMNPLTHHAPKE